MAVENITNYLWITDRICSSGQPYENGFRDISAAGFDAVINLAMPDSQNAIPDEESIVTGLGMMYHHVPVPFDAPNTDQLTQFFSLVESLHGKKVWVHCVANYRVSAFLYLYRRWKGMSEEEAQMALIKDWEPNAVWQVFITQPIETLRYNNSSAPPMHKPRD
jgi:protein tyrosine phosphatase (PTP) superfamily phosphohydrolase (DUF442 family)